MPDAGDTENNVHGDVSGPVFMAGAVHGDVTVHAPAPPRKRAPGPVQAMIAVAVLAAAFGVAAVYRQQFREPPPAAPETSSAAPATTSSVPMVAVTTTTAQRTTTPPPPTVVAPTSRAPEGPGLLVTARSSDEVVDTLGFAPDALLTARKKPGELNAAAQSSWVREFSPTRRGVFRVHNLHLRKCLETATADAARGSGVTTADCSWEREHQLWRADGDRFANARSGECLGLGTAGAPYGTPLAVTVCLADPTQQWRIAR